MVNVCVCVVSPREPAQPLQGSSTIVTSTAARSAPPEWQWGPACYVDTLSSNPSSTRACPASPTGAPIAIAPSLNIPPHGKIKAPIRWCPLRKADHLAQEETPHRELYMFRSLQLLPCIRAEGLQLGKAQLKKCPQRLPVACPYPEWASFRSSESLSASKPWPTCGELDSSAKEALSEEKAHLCRAWKGQ